MSNNYILNLRSQVAEQEANAVNAIDLIQDLKRYLNGPKFNNPQAAGDLLHYVNVNDVLPMLEQIKNQLA